MLKKISWKFRKIHIAISPLVILINDKWDGWGIYILKIEKELNSYSLLKLVWQLPNGGERKLSFSGDFLFLRNPLLKQLSYLEDDLVWSRKNKISNWEKIKQWVLNLMFK